MSIFQEIRKDHDEQRVLVKALLKTHGASDERKALFARLKVYAKVHARVEEQNLYVSLMVHDVSMGNARHSIAEHQELDELFEELSTTSMSSSGWIAIATTLGDRLLHHLDQEEHEVFPIAGKVLGKGEKTSLGKSYRNAMEKGLGTSLRRAS